MNDHQRAVGCGIFPGRSNPRGQSVTSQCRSVRSSKRGIWQLGGGGTISKRRDGEEGEKEGGGKRQGGNRRNRDRTGQDRTERSGREERREKMRDEDGEQR